MNVVVTQVDVDLVFALSDHRLRAPLRVQVVGDEVRAALPLT